MASNQAPTVLIIGHSLVRNLRDDIYAGRQQFDIDFGLDVLTKFTCQGGLNIPKAHALLAQESPVPPVDVIITQVGGNDFQLGKDDAEQVAKSMINFAVFGKQLYRASFVMIGKLFRRGLSPYLPSDADVMFYNEKVDAANAYLSKNAGLIEGVIFWRHRGIEEYWTEHMKYDGTHLNDEGQAWFYKAMRHAIIHSTRLLQKS